MTATKEQSQVFFSINAIIENTNNLKTNFTGTIIINRKLDEWYKYSDIQKKIEQGIIEDIRKEQNNPQLKIGCEFVAFNIIASMKIDDDGTIYN